MEEKKSVEFLPQERIYEELRQKAKNTYKYGILPGILFFVFFLFFGSKAIFLGNMADKLKVFLFFLVFLAGAIFFILPFIRIFYACKKRTLVVKVLTLQSAHCFKQRAGKHAYVDKTRIRFSEGCSIDAEGDRSYEISAMHNPGDLFYVVFLNGKSKKPYLFYAKKFYKLEGEA